MTSDMKETKQLEENPDSISTSKESYDDAPPPPPMAISHGGAATTEPYLTEKEKQIKSGEYKHPFTWSSLWTQEVVNPLNQKSYTLPLLRIWSPYSIAFWMATLGFFVAFLSWFAISPLAPEAIKADLNLSAAELGNSNIAALSATLIVRFIAGPLVDRYGPRKVMAAILIVGAIPSGLAGTAHDAGSLYVIRFFIGILGGTFVPCQAWTTAWFDKSVVGTANALAGGWGNMGGGVTFITQTALFERLRADGLSSRISWRLCFVIVPVPILLVVAAAMLIFARDHPMGHWSQRHQMPATEVAVMMGQDVHLDHSEQEAMNRRDPEKMYSEKGARAMIEPENPTGVKAIDVAVNEPLTLKSLMAIFSDIRMWMLALSYATTFGFELALDANMANSLYTLFKGPNFAQLDAGYYGSIYGLLNICCRLFGGLGSDLLYARFGIQSKKWWLLSLATAQGIIAIGLGMLVDHGAVTLPKFMALVAMLALTGFAANGANYALVPHIASKNNGSGSGLVGGFGSLGGIFYALIFRFQPGTVGRPYWISGIFCTVLNVILMAVPLGDAA